MIDLSRVSKIYIMPGYTDLRLGIDGYAAIVELNFNLSALDGSIYIFCNRNRDKIKILHYERDGFWLYYKRFDTGRIKWPKKDDISIVEERQLRWLLDGLKIEQKGLKKGTASTCF